MGVHKGRTVPDYTGTADGPQAFRDLVNDGVIPRFTNAAARDAAYPGGPEPGEKCFMEDSGAELTYQSATTGWTPPWNTAWGYRTGYESGAAPQITTSGYGLSTVQSFSLPANRRVRITAGGAIRGNAGTSQPRFTFVFGGAWSSSWGVHYVDSLAGTGALQTWWGARYRNTAGSGGPVTYSVQLYADNAAVGTDFYVRGDLIATTLFIEDIGPAGDPV